LRIGDADTVAGLDPQRVFAQRCNAVHVGDHIIVGPSFTLNRPETPPRRYRESRGFA